MILYGRNAVLEALRGRRTVEQVWVARREDAMALPDGHEVKLVGADTLEQLCGSPDHQGYVCDAHDYAYADADLLLSSDDAFVVALDEIQDPQNLGAICRTAEVAGVSGVVIPERRSADITPTVCRASAGAVEHLAIARVRNLADFLNEAKQTGAWIYGAAGEAPTRYTQPDYTGRVVMVLGSEGSGLRPRVASVCDQLVSLPMRGNVESLNVSATAAVLIYEIVRQRTV